MNTKPIITLAIVSAIALGGPQAVASPGDSASIIEQPIVKLLSAKIENAIAELPETRTQDSIKNATYFVLAKQEAARDIKVAAIDTVIVNAQSIGDQLVVDALNLIDLGAEETVTASKITAVKSVRDPEPIVSFRAPPSTVSKGGSDY